VRVARVGLTPIPTRYDEQGPSLTAPIRQPRRQPVRDRGKLVMAGPYVDDSGALLVFDVAVLDELQQREAHAWMSLKSGDRWVGDITAGVAIASADHRLRRASTPPSSRSSPPSNASSPGSTPPRPGRPGQPCVQRCSTTSRASTTQAASSTGSNRKARSTTSKTQPHNNPCPPNRGNSIPIGDTPNRRSARSRRVKNGAQNACPNPRRRAPATAGWLARSRIVGAGRNAQR
jgi:hypothetical protein